MIVFVLDIETDTYHHGKCPLIRTVAKENRRKITVDEVLDLDLKPCEHCQTMGFIFESGKKRYEDNLRSKELSCRLVGNVLLVQSDISFWKIGYDRNKMTFFIYHGNHAPQSSEVETHSKREYHKQKDAPEYYALRDCFTYIYEHDRFRRGDYNGAPRGGREQREKNKRARKNNKRAERKRVYRLLDKLSGHA